jgi:hypothetical protein
VLLATPRSLIERAVLVQPSPPSADEHHGDFVSTEQCLPPAVSEYRAANSVRGQRYVFRYRLGCALALGSTGLRLEAGSVVTLYSVTKYDLESLCGAIRREGFDVRGAAEPPLTVEVPGGVRLYTVIAAVSPGSSAAAATGQSLES